MLKTTLQGMLLIALISVATIAQAGWYDTDWGFRKEITIDYTKVGSTGAPHINYPFLIKITSDADLSAEALASGNDILFTASDGTTKLDYERESYSSGTLTAWVEIPSLSASANTVIYMYYGNSSASDQQDVSGTWNDHYHGVWHMGGNYSDASGSYDLSTTSVSTVTGQIGNGTSFNGSSSKLRRAVSDYRSSDTKGTISVWFKTTNREITLFCSADEGSSYARYLCFYIQAKYGEGYLNIQQRNNDIANTVRHETDVSDGDWHLAHVVTSGSAWSIYLDGNLVSLNTSGGNTGEWFGSASSRDNITFGVMNTSNSANWFNGSMDEGRVSDTCQTAGWILTDYNNQYNNGSTFSIGSEDPLPVEFVYVNAIDIDGKTRLEWATATEINNDYFTIEKSQNGIDFISIGSVAGAGNAVTLNEYTFVDEEVSTTARYYRIKQTDFDGAYDYSQTVVVGAKKPISIRISPNPTTEHVDLQNVSRHSVEYEIIDFAGKRQLGGQLDGQSASRVDLSRLSAGVYNVLIKSSAAIVVKRLVIN